MIDNQELSPELVKVVSKIWSIAETLRGSYKAYQYRDVMLPLIAITRLDSALIATKKDVLNNLVPDDMIENLKILHYKEITNGLNFYNTSKFTLKELCKDSDSIHDNLTSYLESFSSNIIEILQKLKFSLQVEKLHEKDLLLKVLQKITKDLDLSLSSISNRDMGKIYEHLIRKFGEASNEQSGEHFTPRDVIHLMTDILFCNADSILRNDSKIVSIYDPTAGTGGMLSEATNKLLSYNNSLKIKTYGQELNDETYALCKIDMIIKGGDESQIVHANTLTDDGFKNEIFTYMMANPPYGVDWKGDKKTIEKLEENGDNRFKHGKPRTSDGQLLFLEHMISKMDQTGSQIGIVLNGSPLFTGDAGSGESNIRRSIIEADLLECVIALPSQMFFNTGINTYIWILNNKKLDHKKGKIQLINAVDIFEKMKKSLGNKRNEISHNQIAEITKLFSDFESKDKRVKIFNNNDFAFIKLGIEKPLTANEFEDHEKLDLLSDHKDTIMEKLKKIEDSKITFSSQKDFAKFLGVKLKANQLKILIKSDSESIPLTMAIPKNGFPLGYDKKSTTDEIQALTHSMCEDYLQVEVYPHLPSAWADYSKIKLGYEIPFTRHFFTYHQPRTLQEIQAELSQVESNINTLLKELEI